MSEYMANGVKVRADNGGDPWAYAHRKELGSRYLMQDIDAAFGAMAFGTNSGDTLFMEYVPDGVENKGKSRREFMVIAMFDRKKTESAIAQSTLSKAFYLHQCRVNRKSQGLSPRFFYVVGEDQPPWKMIEVDIDSGEFTGVDAFIHKGEWRQMWSVLGLTQLRDEAEKMIQRKQSPVASEIW